MIIYSSALQVGEKWRRPYGGSHIETIETTVGGGFNSLRNRFRFRRLIARNFFWFLKPKKVSSNQTTL